MIVAEVPRCSVLCGPLNPADVPEGSEVDQRTRASDENKQTKKKPCCSVELLPASAKPQHILQKL